MAVGAEDDAFLDLVLKGLQPISVALDHVGWVNDFSASRPVFGACIDVCEMERCGVSVISAEEASGVQFELRCPLLVHADNRITV